MKFLPKIFFIILGFAFSFITFFLLFPSRQPAFAQQACYITGITDVTTQCSPGGQGNSCSTDQYSCNGNTREDGTGSTCTACVSGATTEKLTCSRIAGPPNDGQSCLNLGYDRVVESCGGSQCTGIYSDGCRYCVAPQCSPGQCFDGINNPGCTPCASLSCAVTSATPTGPTTADATSDDTGGDFSGYDRVDWFLNSTYVGTTAMNTTNGTSSNTFTNLVAGTQYNLGAHYVDTEGGRPAVDCSGYTFQFNPSPTQTTCSLSADPQSLSIGQYSTWTLSSTNEPSGAQALWHITANGVTSTRTTAPDYIDTVLYNTSGSDSRSVEVKNSSGTTLCTTDTMQVYVNPNNCRTLSITPSSLNLTVGGQGTLTAQGIDGNISSWSSDNTSIASVTSFGNPTTVSGRGAGTTRVKVRDSGQGSCISETVSVPVQVFSSGTFCPDGINGCGDNNRGGTSLSCPAGNQAWLGEPYDSWCREQTGGTKPYCYQCVTAAASPSPSPSSVISGGFESSGVSVSGPLLVGRMLEDFNANFRIDEGIDTLVSKLTSLVSGTLRTLSGTNTFTGTFMNVLGHASAVYKYKLAGAGVPAKQTVSYMGATGASSNFVKVANSQNCTSTRYGETYPDPSCNIYWTPSEFNRSFKRANTPFENISQYELKTGYYTGDSYQTNAYTQTFSHVLSNVEAGSCGSGCTVATGVTFNNVTAEQRCHSVGDGQECSESYPLSAGSATRKNSDNTCFFKEYESYEGTWWDFLTPYCSGNTCVFQNYTFYNWSSNQSPYNVQEYRDCTKYTYNKSRTSTVPWSVSFASPTITPPSSLTTGDWYSLFNIVSPEGCYLDRNTNRDTVSPASAGQYCTCQVWESGGEYYSTFDCTYPLKAGETFGGAPPGDYIFSIAVSGTNQVRYRVTAGSSELVPRTDGRVESGVLTFNFTVPDSAVGQTVSVELSQKGGGEETVTFGAPGLYPKGWYEANVVFGLGREAYLKARVVDPPDDYPYTVGQVPPADNYCSRTANIEQCWNFLRESTLFYNKINQVDYLLADLKAGGWFQVKDADLQAIGNLISYIPSSCKLPGCVPQLGLPGTGGFPGVPAYTGTAAFGSGTVSEKGWLANSGYAGRRYDYNYFKSLLGSVGGVVDLRTAGRGTISGDTLTLDKNDLSDIASSSGTGFARFDGNLVLVDLSGGGNVNLENKRLAIFADGDVLVRLRINLRKEEGFFGLFSGGSIVIDPGVKSENPNQYGLEGVFLANGAITTGTNNPIPGSGTADEQLYIRGMLAAWGGVSLQRDLDPAKSTGTNNTKPAEVIEYAPDLVLNFPKELLRRGSVWREVAP